MDLGPDVFSEFAYFAVLCGLFFVINALNFEGSRTALGRGFA